MKKIYKHPSSVCVEMKVESIIATSLSKSDEHADGNFQELGNKKNPIWD